MTNNVMQQLRRTARCHMTYVLVIFSRALVFKLLSTVCTAVIAAMTPTVWRSVGRYVKSEPIDTAAKSNCAHPYSVEAAPAICPIKFSHPQSQLISGTQPSGARYLQVKYKPPQVG